ncbi:S-adenosylmethionine synthetase, partial [Lecanoromycetidae sp. Uapishka_2]
MARTVLITGATGLLGRQVLLAFERAGWNAVGTAFTRPNPPAILKVDLSKPVEISSVLQEVKPEVVVHCAANRFPDKCDLDPDGARKINVEASRYLAEMTSKDDIFLIYISTDYVFPGKPGEAPYEIDATPQPPNFYGQTKLDGEKAILGATKETGLGVVLRVPVLYGKDDEPKGSAINVLMDALWKSQEKGAQVKMDHWAQRYPTNTEDVARVCLDISKKYLNDREALHELPNILQFSSEDRMTKYEICELFAEVMGLPLNGIVAETAGNDPNARVQRPYDTHLSTKALRDIGIDVRTQDFKAWWKWEVKAFRK